MITERNDTATFDQGGLVRTFCVAFYDIKSHIFHCKLCVHAKAKNVFVTGKDCAKPKKDDLAKHDISADHQRSTLLPKRQMDFMTANDYTKSAIITHVLTQAKHNLPTVMNAFI